MKKLIVACAIMSCASLTSMAQNAAPNPPQKPAGTPGAPAMANPEQRENAMAEHEAKTYEKLYALNAEQYKGVYQASLEMAKKMDALRASGKQPKREDFEAMMSEKDAKFKKVMTPEQYAKYESTRRRPNPPSQPGAPMAPTPAQAPLKN